MKTGERVRAIKKLEAERDSITSQIDKAYWTFTRTKRGKPPAITHPHLYKRRNEIEDEIKTLRGQR